MDHNGANAEESYKQLAQGSNRNNKNRKHNQRNTQKVKSSNSSQFCFAENPDFRIGCLLFGQDLVCRINQATLCDERKIERNEKQGISDTWYRWISNGVDRNSEDYLTDESDNSKNPKKLRFLEQPKCVAENDL